MHSAGKAHRSERPRRRTRSPAALKAGEFGNFLPARVVGRLRNAFRLIYERAGRVFAVRLLGQLFARGRGSAESEKANKLRRPIR